MEILRWPGRAFARCLVATSRTLPVSDTIARAVEAAQHADASEFPISLGQPGIDEETSVPTLRVRLHKSASFYADCRRNDPILRSVACTELKKRYHDQGIRFTPAASWGILEPSRAARIAGGIGTRSE